MNQTIKNLLEEYNRENYPMSSGSDKWADIKGDYELENDALIGTSMHENLSEVGFGKISGFERQLNEFKQKVDAYIPRDLLEVEEKRIIKLKADIGLKIYSLILDNLK